MNRRIFGIGAGATAISWSIDAFPQVGRRPVVGALFYSNPEPSLGMFTAALGRLGYRIGDTLELDLRLANGSDALLSEFAGALVARKVDVIFAFTTPAAVAAKAATGAIPIVMVAADPVGTGLVASLAMPGGNVTGVSLAVRDVTGKLLGLLREAVPSARRMGLLINTADPFHRQMIEGVEEANLIVNVDLRIYRAAQPDEIEAAFKQMAAEKIDAAIIQPTLPRGLVIELAMQNKLPTAQAINNYANHGGFMSYAASATEHLAVAAAQIDQILKGAKPANIPVRQPSKFIMALNLTTAKALGLTVPPLLLAKADEIIE